MIIDGLEIQNVSSAENLIKVSAVIGVIFDGSGKLLMVKNQRGWDFPGGHVESGESPVDALVREVAEEAYITVASPKPFLAAGNEEQMVFYEAKLDKLLPFLGEFETSKRKFIQASEFLSLYRGGMPNMAAYVISESS